MKLKDFVLWVGHLLVLTALIYQSARGSLLGVIAVALVLSVDWVSALTALALEIPLFLALRIRVRTVAVRGAVVTVAAALTAQPETCQP